MTLKNLYENMQQKYNSKGKTTEIEKKERVPIQRKKLINPREQIWVKYNIQHYKIETKAENRTCPLLVSTMFITEA